MSSSKPQFEAGHRPDVQHQPSIDPNLPGHENLLDPKPQFVMMADGRKYKPAEKLLDKVALVTGGDSGIGRSICVLYSMEGCSGIALAYHPSEEEDAAETKRLILKEAPSTKVVLIAKDLSSEENCLEVIKQTIDAFGSLDVLVHNAAHQREHESILDVTSEEWRRTFAINIDAIFYLTKAALQHMPSGSSIIFNASINPFVGHPGLVPYTSTKGAIVGFARSLSNQIVGEKKIRCNTVCPGPIWTPLVAHTMTDESLESFGVSTPMKRPGQPVEVATCFVFLASNDSSYISGQCIHVNGGTVIA